MADVDVVEVRDCPVCGRPIRWEGSIMICDCDPEDMDDYDESD